MSKNTEYKEMEKKRVPAATRGRIGAVVGLIIMAIFLICFDAWTVSVGEYVDRTRYLGMLAVAPLYGFGYAFGYKKMAGWFANALHYSGSIMGFAFIRWVLTGSKKGFLRGIMLIMILFGLVAGAAWLPGIPMGIREIRRERKQRALESAEMRQENKERRREEKARKLDSREERKTAGMAANQQTRQQESERAKQPNQGYASEAHCLEAPDYHYSQEENVSNSAAAEAVSRNEMPVSPLTGAVSFPGSRMLCFGGDFAGGSFDLSDGKTLVIGRDPGQSNIVVSGRDISRAHCMVRYSAADKCGMVRDLSTNGISFLDGTSIPKGQFVKVESGNGIRIGTNGPVFLFN